MKSPAATPPAGRTHTDNQVYRNSLREAKIILTFWGVSTLYSATYCYVFGYLSHPTDAQSTGSSIASVIGPLTSFNRTPASMTMPLGLGIPDWVFYGVVVPWGVCILASFWFCLFVFQEDDLDA